MGVEALENVLAYGLLTQIELKSRNYAVLEMLYIFRHSMTIIYHSILPSSNMVCFSEVKREDGKPSSEP